MPLFGKCSKDLASYSAVFIATLTLHFIFFYFELIFLFHLFYVHECFAYIYVCLLHTSLVPMSQKI